MDFLFNAFKKLTETFEDIGLFIAGDGPERDNLETFCIENNIEDRVVFSGYIAHKDVFTAYASCDLIVFPSKSETQGLSLLEGLSFGKPAVCINAMGVSDILANDKGGFLTKDNLSDYIAHVALLLKDRAVYKQKSTEALELVNSFSAPYLAEKLEKVYEDVLKNYEYKQKRDFSMLLKSVFLNSKQFLKGD